MILFLGNGFIASAFSAKLDKAGIEHRIVSRSLVNEPPARIQADIKSLIEIDEVFDGIDTVIYFAHSSVPYTSMQNILKDAEENILNAILLFEVCAKKKLRVIYISSGGSVYGNQSGLTSEESLASPISAYGVSKFTIENYLKVFNHNYQLPFDILRLSNIYGVGQKSTKPQGVIAAIAQSFIGKRKIEVWGDGNARKDYLYIDDLTEALMKVAATPPSNGIYNISQGESISVSEIISKFEKIFGYSIEAEKLPSFNFDVRDVFLDNSKFAKDYDWTPKINIEMGIRKTINWLTCQK